MITPAQRVSQVKEYYFSLKLKEIAQMIEDGKPVINLGIGNPDQPPAPEVLETLNKTASRPDTHGYQGYVGIPALRKGFADWYLRSYNVELDADKEILPLMGSKEGIMHISLAFLNPGDEVLVPNPGYPTYAAVTQLVEAVERTYDLQEDNNWQPDLDALEKEDLSKVKLMWVNYPNMPTGAKASKSFFEKLVDFAKRNDILICNDNPYSFIMNEDPQSLLSIPGAKDVAVELNSLSKSHNMAGWRVGMAASNPDFIKYILRIKSNMDSGMFRPVQEAAAKALSLEKEWYEEVNKVYKQRKKLVLEIMDTLGCTWKDDQVGMFIWAKIPDQYPTSKELSDKVLYEANVFITPGFIFGSQGEKYIRISLCTSEEKLQESLSRIKNIITN
ncbi:pyridoxal phosphate-dependent aminotransferase [Marinilabilia rubra]|uniref:Aminotransferase n=1 Tax=Marinilabilia rubra TaxID=2162893 RepID=A0A2U2B4Z0_9BACT|nr:aminotransferase class I/II-fold pyridoxal phosphate-dependent enzyme [Marinilabilia rubra]PWD98125.1 aminotransferase [Marinilabilia rubra]